MPARRLRIRIRVGSAISPLNRTHGGTGPRIRYNSYSMRLPSQLLLRKWTVAAFFCGALLVWPALGQKEPKEPETEVLLLPRELPMAVAGDTSRLSFQVTPLSGKGLLSQQVRDALKSLESQTRNAVILRIRAFVAGRGDLRRVRDMVSESFTSSRRPLPALSLVQVGALPLAGAQIVLEAESSSARDVNPNGLAFISAQGAASPDPLAAPGPLTGQAAAALRRTLTRAGSQPQDVLRVTCYLSSLDNLAASRTAIETQFPRATVNYVQMQRSPAASSAACEAVARIHAPPPQPLLVNADGLQAEPGVSHLAVIGPSRLAFAGTQLSFGYGEADARLAVARLQNSIAQAVGEGSVIAMARYYPLSSGIAAQLRQLRPEFFAAAAPPAGGVFLCEGLGSLDAGFAVDAVAIAPSRH